MKPRLIPNSFWMTRTPRAFFYGGFYLQTIPHNAGVGKQVDDPLRAIPEFYIPQIHRGIRAVANGNLLVSGRFP